jgi:UDP-3-O-[3-hydroxymyristoyl] glucosamine N-acyltransferase
MMTKLKNLILQLELLFDYQMIEFKRVNFFPLKNKFSSIEIPKLIQDNIIDYEINDIFDILDISSFDYIKSNSILFLKNDFELNDIDLDFLFLITDNEKTYNNMQLKNKVLINNHNEVYNSLLHKIFLHEDCLDFFDDFILKDGSHISKFANIDKTAIIQKNCIIGRGVEIGKNVLIKHNTVIKNSIISDNTIICENSTIGSTGFGFDLDKMGSIHLSPQLGIVYVDENVFIGSNCTIDRGKIDFTYIGKNSMLDNLIHIGHNVILGPNACLAAQIGISGSVKIGKNLICGGQTGFAGHINVGDNVRIAAKSGVTKNIKDNSTIAGFPATDIKLWRQNIINERKNRHK